MNKIDRNLLISTYDSLVLTELSKEELYKKYILKQNIALENLYAQYYKNYSQHPAVKYHTKDLSQLYKNEHLTTKVAFIENKLDKQNVIGSVTYKNVVNSAFPCKSTTQCLTNMENAIQLIDDKSSKDMKNIQIKLALTTTNYKTILEKETKNLKIEYKKDLQYHIFKDKTIYYKLLTEDTIRAKVKALNVTYEIIDIDYRVDIYR